MVNKPPVVAMGKPLIQSLILKTEAFHPGLSEGRAGHGTTV
jgi:hypothetical protein